MKIVLDRVAPAALRQLVVGTLPSWATFVDVARSDAAFAGELADADVLLHVLDPITADDIAGASRLRLIQKLGTGVNTIDLDAAERHGVAVTNMPGANAPAVAELTVALILAALRRLPRLHRGTVSGDAWPGRADEPVPGVELGGRTVGLVGYGAIARRVEAAVAALGAHTVHHSTTPGRDGWVSLDDLVAGADVVSLHLPLTAATTLMFDRDRLAAMRRGAVLVNTSRGGLVDHDALVELLDDGHLAAAGLDVLPDEPLDPSHPLLHTDGVVVTPHVGWYTDETLARCWERGLDNCRRLRDGAELRDRVR